MDYVRDVLVRMLRTPSPTGRTDEVMHLIGEELQQLGVDFYLTRLGSLVAEVRGEQARPDRAVVVHSDTIGCIVKRIRENGRLQVTPVGTFSARFAEGARVRVFTDDPDTTYTGTVLPLKASGHTFGDEVDVQRVAWEQVEVRIDEFVESPDETEALGIRAGDFVSLDANPVITPAGFVNSRHLDDKAGVAAALGAFKCVIDHELALPVNAHLLVTIAEEVGQGASHGLDADVAEMISVDNAVVAPGQYSRETGVNVAMKDEVGPFDYHLTRKLLRLCRELGIPAQRDVFNYYRSDIATALNSGAETRAALIGCGVDASHGHERTHLDGIRNVAELLVAYLQTPLMFAWDEERRGELADFPAQDAEAAIGEYR
ncbi:osmoprotectant NAGGN system M42 family peptidase [Egibacter rhizosphaerae]|uniref:Osmoprotectant NAGGN system M42 family peptidase n=1 Tax=Egibacter rhizosphaerae TaxID=1670831 RepID=A0A411YL85_9ACTN|nr:osmoprotectant NAGGN system M42 family peptidase [Egibacter rhizosphaerae]